MDYAVELRRLAAAPFGNDSNAIYQYMVGRRPDGKRQIGREGDEGADRDEENALSKSPVLPCIPEQITSGLGR